MNLKKLFALLLALLLSLSAVACRGNPQGENTDSSGETMVIGPLSGETDEALLTRFTAEYEKALSSPAYVMSYNLGVRLDGDPRLDAVGQIRVNGQDFSAELETILSSTNEPVKVSCTYLNGTVYLSAGGTDTQVSADAEQAKAQLDSLGMTYRQIAASQFAEKALTRNMDGTFTVNVKLNDTALKEISDAALAQASKYTNAEFAGASLSVTFTGDGSLARSVLVTSVNVTENETVKEYRTETYLQYETFDASKIVITAPSAE